MFSRIRNMVLPTEDLMPTSTSLHPTNRPGAGMTKGDTVPPPPAPPGSLYVVTSYIWDDQYWLEGLRPPEVYATAAAANAAARRLMVRHAELLDEIGGDVDEAFDFEHNPDQECGDVGLYNGRLAWKKAHEAAVVRVFCVEGSEVIAGAAAAGGETTRGKRARGTAGGGGGGGRVKSEQVSDDDGGDNDDEKEEGEEEDTKPAAKRPRRLASGSKAAATSSASASGKGKGKGKAAAAAVPKTAVQAATYRKQIPEGKPNCLRGLKLLFTGTFETMDRRTSLATAARYGAEVVTKLEETDYVVVGLRAGPKKLREINEKELETISEEEFFHILEHGVSPEKRKRMAARRRAEEEEGGEGEESEDGEEKKAGRTRWKRARR
ncbi:hypothetical protein SLS62_006935 [Diatrype stigma]|uniref:BRCT domain-containing protein n=1 Tax=Diatrype stigma TaxID=117547 RepID=A0AAN9UNI9_9PEZI